MRTHFRFKIILAAALALAALWLLDSPAPSWAGTSILEPRVGGTWGDAVESSDGAVVSDSQTLQLDAGTTVGLWFASLPIPRGASITKAYIDLVSDDDYAGDLKLTIKGQDSALPAPFLPAGSGSHTISSRAATQAAVSWDLSDWREKDVYTSPDLTAIVQYLVNKADWVFGRPMAFIVTAAGTGQRFARSFNTSDGKYAPLLHIEYTANAVSVPIAASSDDAEEEEDGDMKTASSKLDLGDDENDVGLRFQNVNIDRGAPISYAFIEFFSADDKDNTCNMVFYGQKDPDPQTFTNVDDNIRDRNRTEASVQWNDVPAWGQNTRYYSPDLKAIVQEIVGQAGWHRGNAMAFIIDGLNSDREAYAWDYDPQKAPVLHIGFEGSADPVAILATDTNEVGASTIQGQNAGERSFRVSNVGLMGTDFSYTVTYRQGSGWLSVTPAEGGSLAPGETREFTVSFDAANLEPSTVTADIEITAEGAVGSPQTVSVSLTVLGTSEEEQSSATCGNVPVYTENMATPAVMVLLDISSSMGSKLDVASMDPLPRTPDLKGIVQQIVDRPSWQPAVDGHTNAMVFMIKGSEGGGKREAYSWDKLSGSAPRLYLKYQDGGIKEFTTRIKQSADDAFEEAGQAPKLNDNRLELNDKGADGIVALRFQNIPVPQGAAVLEAYIEFYPGATHSDPATLSIAAQLHDNPGPFREVADDIHTRYADPAQRTAEVSWVPEAWEGTTKERRIDIGKDVISELVKDRSISWGYGTWCNKSPWKDQADESYTLIHVPTAPNTDEHQARLQAQIAATEKQSGTPFSPSILGAIEWFKGEKDVIPYVIDENGNGTPGDATGERFNPVDCQPKFLIDITDGRGNKDSSVENIGQRLRLLYGEGVSAVGVGFALPPSEAEQLYEFAKVANELGAASDNDKLYALHPDEDGDGIGEPYFAFNKSELLRALRQVTENIKGAIFRGSAPAPTTTTDLGDTVIVAQFDAANWVGDLIAYTKDSRGLWVEKKWAASEALPASRSLWTADALGNVVAYSDSTLGRDNFTCFAAGKPIGDIVDSTPVVVGPPPFWYPFDNYRKFAGDWSRPVAYGGRETMIYVGANDGALHAFRLSDGVEQWAFVPPSLHAKLNLAVDGHGNPTVFDRCEDGYCHQYFVNGTPVVADVHADFDGDAAKEWRTLLVTGLREGGASYFALDVTSGRNFDDDGDPARFLWEFTDDELGQSWAEPEIARVGVLNENGVLAAKSWGVYLSSGYPEDPAQASGKQAYLYGLRPEDATGLWDDDGDPGTYTPLARIPVGGAGADLTVTGYDPSTHQFAEGDTIKDVDTGATATIVAIHDGTAEDPTVSFDLANLMGTINAGDTIRKLTSDGNLTEMATAGGIGLYGGNALTAPLAADLDGNRVNDRLYVGNLYGNLLRVDKIGYNMLPEVSTLFTFDNHLPNVNPLRAKPAYAYSTMPGDIWVYFGTGIYEKKTDKLLDYPQYFIGIKDSKNDPPDAYRPEDLLKHQAKFQTAMVNEKQVTFRVIEGANPDADPWMIELLTGENQAAFNYPGVDPLGSERVITEPLTAYGVVFFTTFIPDDSVCSGSGETWVFAVDYRTGLAPNFPVWDINKDGLWNDSDKLEVDGELVIPVGIKVGRGKGSHPVLHKDTLFITVTGDGDDGGGMGNGEEKFFAQKVNLPEMKVRVRAWLQR